MRIWRQYGRQILLGAMILTVGLLVGLIIQLPIGREQEPPVEHLPAEQVSRTGEKNVLPQTAVTVRYTFLRCGHILEQPYNNQELIGLTADQVETLWQNAHVMELEQDHALVERELNACCPEHYLLQTKEDLSLWYVKTDGSDYTKQTETEIPFDAAQLPDDVQAALKSGIVFDRLGEIDLYLEGVES